MRASRCLALDVGDERIGVAVSDAGGRIAQPLVVIRRVAGSASMQRVAQLVAEYGVERVVVGLPLLRDGSEGKQAASVRAYLRGLAAFVAAPVELYDERDSTTRAEEILRASPGGRARALRRLDAVAAAVILQDYLDEVAGGSRAV
ncbi:MAG: Holliday junction resolvase RuvX [Chloroflexota bacterium]